MSTQFVSLKCSLSILTFICAASSVSRASLSDADKTAFVLAHNRLRETAFPSAVGMRFITWDANLERLAVAAAKRCDYQHSFSGEYDGLGENIYTGGRTNPYEITLGFYSEKGAYSADMTLCDGCGYYEQIMTTSVEKIGCGIKRECRPGVNMVYCEYNTGNDYFVRGPVCSACPATMSLCLNGLCVNKDLATNPLMKDVDSTVTTAAAFQKSASSTVTCSPCTGSPPCLNSGTEDSSDPLKCKCKCPTGFLGNRCETQQGQLDNSVKLVLAAASEFRFAKWVIMPPVSRSLFNSKIWAALQMELAKAVNSFCRTDAINFVKCCPGKTFPADPTSIATAEHVKATDFGFIESSVGHRFDTYNLLVFATVSSSSQLCPPSASGVQANPSSSGPSGPSGPLTTLWCSK